jgi:signal transduction histidine kinase
MTTSTSGPADAARVPWPRSRRGELALILVVALAQVGGTTLAATHQTGTIGVGGYLLLGGAVLVLFGRQRYPVGVLLASCSLTLAYSVSRGPRGPIYFALIAASVSAVVAGKRRVVIGVLIVGYVAFQWLPPLVGTHPGPSALAAFLVGAWLLVLWLGAEWIRGRALRLAALARSREEEARRLASDERLRIARELHDVLAHDISLINVQASSALHLIDRQPERAREALAAIKEVSKEALVELRSVLGVLRQVDEAAPLSPAPSLDRLDELLARTETTGLQLRLERPEDPVPRPLPSAVDQAAYRIVQEALTNVTRHARATTATVRITRSAGHLVVEVEDDGATAAVPGNGHGGTGIAGMRERATALGGNLQAGGRPTGGFRVRAWLPL